MPITAPPTIPQITDPSTFATRAQDWVVWQADELYPALVDEATLLGLSTTTTSITSNTVGTGSKSFTVETGKGFKEGQSITIARTAAPTNRMFAVVDSYNTGTGALVVTSQAFEGSGTFTHWTITLGFNGIIGLGQIDSGAIASIQAGVKLIPVRQTVLSGPVDTNGLPSFGGSTGSTTVTASGTLIVTAANGFDSNGAVNRVGSITNPSWTGLSTNGTMYLYLDIAADGTCTTGSTILAPTYRWGGADVTTNNQFTFNIQEMVGKVGNGSVATQTYRVFVGEVTVSGSVVTVITWYALMGKYRSPETTCPSSANLRTTFNCNLGVQPLLVKALLINKITQYSYAVDEYAYPLSIRDDSSYVYTFPPEVPESRNVVSYITGNHASRFISVLQKSATVGTINVITTANWRLIMIAERGW